MEIEECLLDDALFKFYQDNKAYIPSDRTAYCFSQGYLAGYTQAMEDFRKFFKE